MKIILALATLLAAVTAQTEWRGYTVIETGEKCPTDDRVFEVQEDLRDDIVGCAQKCLSEPPCEFFTMPWCFGCQSVLDALETQDTATTYGILSCPGGSEPWLTEDGLMKDLSNDDEIEVTTGVANQQACAASCFAVDSCTAFEYRYSDGKCKLKEEYAQTDGTQSGGWLSCTEVCPSGYQPWLTSNGAWKDLPNDNEVVVTRSDTQSCAATCTVDSDCVAFEFKASSRKCKMKTTYSQQDGAQSAGWVSCTKNVGGWGNWGTCTATCAGFQSRTRSHDGEVKYRVCNRGVSCGAGECHADWPEARGVVDTGGVLTMEWMSAESEWRMSNELATTQAYCRNYCDTQNDAGGTCAGYSYKSTGNNMNSGCSIITDTDQFATPQGELDTYADSAGGWIMCYNKLLATPGYGRCPMGYLPFINNDGEYKDLTNDHETVKWNVDVIGCADHCDSIDNCVAFEYKASSSKCKWKTDFDHARTNTISEAWITCYHERRVDPYADGDFEGLAVEGMIEFQLPSAEDAVKLGLAAIGLVATVYHVSKALCLKDAAYTQVEDLEEM